MPKITKMSKGICKQWKAVKCILVLINRLCYKFIIDIAKLFSKIFLTLGKAETF